MSQEKPQPWKFPELYTLAHHFFQDLLGLLQARFGDPPRWPAADSLEIQYDKRSEQYRSFTTALTRREYPVAAVLSIWAGEVVHLASFEPLMEQLRSLVETKQINPTFLHPGFLIPFAKLYLSFSDRCTFDESIFEEVYKMGEDYLTRESLTGKLFIELLNLKTELDELVLSPQHRVLRLSQSVAKHIWTVATSVEVPEMALFRPGGGDPTPIPGDTIIEAIFEVKSVKLNETPFVQSQEFRACALALRLCEPGGGRIEPMAAEYEPLVPAWARQRLVRGLTPGIFSYALDASVAERIRKAWPACYALASELARDSGNVPLPLRIAAKRFAGSFEKQGNEDKLIDYVIGLEALLGRENEAIAYRIPLRLATLIGGGPVERIRIFDVSKKSYDLRSKLVHGSDQLREHVTIKGTKVPWRDFLLEVQGYLIRCIHLFMKARARSVAKDAVLAIIEKAIVSQDRAELERELCQ